jgi:hypothetical protein
MRSVIAGHQFGRRIGGIRPLIDLKRRGGRDRGVSRHR